MKNKIVPKKYNLITITLGWYEDIVTSIVTSIVFTIACQFSLVFFSALLYSIIGYAIIGAHIRIETAPFLFLFCHLIVSIIAGYYLWWKPMIQKNWDEYVIAISNAYCWNIREALKTEYPQGIIYILENTLKELEKFNLKNRQAYQNTISLGNGTSQVRGFPNQTHLKEAIYMAQDLIEEWSILNRTERARSMSEIRAKIKAEEIFLDWRYMHKNDIPKKPDIYWYQYTEEDHQNYLSLNHQSSAQKPKSKVSNSPEVLEYDEWLDEHYSGLQFVPEEGRRQAYEKYLESMGVQNSYSNILTFEEWLEQNPGIDFLDPVEQQKLYQKYRNSL